MEEYSACTDRLYKDRDKRGICLPVFTVFSLWRCLFQWNLCVHFSHSQVMMLSRGCCGVCRERHLAVLFARERTHTRTPFLCFLRCFLVERRLIFDDRIGLNDILPCAVDILVGTCCGLCRVSPNFLSVENF